MQSTSSLANHNLIEHDGIVEQIENRTIYVKIISQSACASCHAKGVCGGSDSTEKIIEVATDDFLSYCIGDKVVVQVSRTLGFKGLLLGYLIPAILVVATLVIASMLTNDEGIAGLVSLGVLFPYYFTLYLLRNKIKKTFQFSIKKPTQIS